MRVAQLNDGTRSAAAEQDIETFMMAGKLTALEWDEVVKDAGFSVEQWSFESLRGAEKLTKESRIKWHLKQAGTDKHLQASLPDLDTTEPKQPEEQPEEKKHHTNWGGSRKNSGKKTKVDTQAHYAPILEILVKMLKEDFGSLKTMASKLNELGHRTQTGKPLTAVQIHRVIKRENLRS